MVFYWVCNEKEDIEKAVACGAHGIMGDDVEALDSYIKQPKELSLREMEEIGERGRSEDERKEKTNNH